MVPRTPNEHAPDKCGIQVAPDHYKTGEYNSRERYYSFIEQITVTASLSPSSIVEIGIGNGFFTRLARDLGITVTTVDFDEGLNPDIVASVDDIPLPTGSADACMCFQVLEHLPFDRLGPSMRELARVSREWVFVSIPDARPSIRLEVARGWTGKQPFRLMLNSIPFRKPPVHVFDGQHHWEIGKSGTPQSRVITEMTVPGLTLVRHYRFHAFPYHHFFLFRKTHE